ncbi:hypothetical protein Fmac_017950 [Flemingia macrophylla]|uniref:Uncharacterized protein n=1 Tax=Flemingia macrophylla TaxID=520843 RepID=A0ABD1M3L3_9FABA
MIDSFLSQYVTSNIELYVDISFESCSLVPFDNLNVVVVDEQECEKYDEDYQSSSSYATSNSDCSENKVDECESSDDNEFNSVMPSPMIEPINIYQGNTINKLYDKSSLFYDNTIYWR